MVSTIQILVFILTFLSYAAYHCSRTYWAYIQDSMHTDINGYDKNYTGYVNLAFLFIYSVFMIIVGPMGGKWNLSYLFGIGSLSAGISLGLMGFCGLFGVLNPTLIIVFMMMNGISQSTGYPSLVAIMSNYFKGANIGLIMGFWAGDSNFGDVLGLMIGDVVVEKLNLSYNYGTLACAGYLLVIGLCVIIFLNPSPQTDVNSPLIEEIASGQEQSIQQSNDAINPTEKSSLNQPTAIKINIFNVWCLPGVALYTLGYMCLKGTFLGFLFWLPDYFQSFSNLKSQSSYIASMFDIGSFVGGMAIGFVGDRIGKRAIIISPSLVIAALLMIAVKIAGTDSAIFYYFTIFGIGLFQGGSYNNISGAIAIELGKMKQLQGNKQATSLVSSIIEGCGSLMGAAFQIIIPRIPSDYLFIFFTTITGLAEIAALFLMLKELKRKES